jgi:hypothetical protein
VKIRTALLASAFLVSSASAADAPKPAADVPAEVAPGPITDSVCSGSVSGAVQANFSCTITVTKKADGLVNFEVKPTAPVKGLKSFQPATFAIKGPITVQTYMHRDLASGASSAQTSAGKKFSASAKLADRGDIEVQVQSMEKTRNRFPLAVVHYHAHMVPADAKDKAEIQVDVQFEGTW